MFVCNYFYSETGNCNNCDGSDSFLKKGISIAFQNIFYSGERKFTDFPSTFMFFHYVMNGF